MPFLLCEGLKIRYKIYIFVSSTNCLKSYVMLKTLLSSFILLLTVQFGYSQLTASTNTVGFPLEEGIDTELTVYVTNTSDQPKTLKWVRDVSNLPEGWINFVCDTEQCYLPSTEEAEFDVVAGEEVPLKVTFRATTLAETSMTLEVFDKNNVSDKQIITFNVQSFPTSNDEINVEAIKIYPNPAADFIKVSNSNGIGTLEVYNLIGKKVRTFTDVDDSNLYNVSDLPKGMYLIRFLDEDNEAVGTKRISKR